MAGSTIQVLNAKDYQDRLERLREIGARKRDITSIFRKALNPLAREVKRQTDVSKRGTRSRAYSSRAHPPGNLRRSVKFKTSKKFKNVYYVLYDNSRKQQYDTFYQTFYVRGTKHYPGRPVPEQAYLVKETEIKNKIEQGFFDLENKLWQGGK